METPGAERVAAGAANGVPWSCIYVVVGFDGTYDIHLEQKLDDLADAGCELYAVVRAVGQSSDGRGKGLLAPSEEGETLAIRRAYESSGIEPRTVTLIEAHGTGIPLGDATEIQALKNVFGTTDAPQGSIALGSVKSMISHCIPAAGMAGLIKTALAVHHRVLPPTLCDEVNPALDEMISAATGLGCDLNGRPCRVSNQADLSRAIMAHADTASYARNGKAGRWERLQKAAGDDSERPDNVTRLEPRRGPGGRDKPGH